MSEADEMQSGSQKRELQIISCKIKRINKGYEMNRGIEA